MKKSDLEYLIEQFLYKLEQSSNPWGFSITHEGYEKVLKHFVDWCEHYKLFDSESTNENS